MSCFFAEQRKFDLIEVSLCIENEKAVKPFFCKLKKFTLQKVDYDHLKKNIQTIGIFAPKYQKKNNCFFVVVFIVSSIISNLSYKNIKAPQGGSVTY